MYANLCTQPPHLEHLAAFSRARLAQQHPPQSITTLPCLLLLRFHLLLLAILQLRLLRCRCVDLLLQALQQPLQV
jgi:hypothetical protein